ncbi:hypothetical protein B0H13DRAFT_2346823 [Mycena leptocephala]|nr:hypothetical protein B0H13DRAFT_2346823 [Mycena leptocephala]
MSIKFGSRARHVSTGSPAAVSNNTAGHPPPIQGPPAIPAELFEAYASDASEADERDKSASSASSQDNSVANSSLLWHLLRNCRPIDSADLPLVADGEPERLGAKILGVDAGSHCSKPKAIFNAVCHNNPPELISLADRADISDCCTTGDAKLDMALGGGFRSGMVWEVFGEGGAGKTQLALQAALFVQLPAVQGGLFGSPCYITINSALHTKRLLQLITNHPLLSWETCSLDNIQTIATPTIPILISILSKRPRYDHSRLEQYYDIFQVDDRAEAGSGEELHYKQQSSGSRAAPYRESRRKQVWAAWPTINARIMMSRTGRRRFLDHGPNKRQKVGESSTVTTLDPPQDDWTMLRRLSVVFSSVAPACSLDYIISAGGVSLATLSTQYRSLLTLDIGSAEDLAQTDTDWENY